MSDFGTMIEGAIKRGLEYALQDILPNAAATVAGPFGALLKAALTTDFVKNLENQLIDKADAFTSAEYAKVEKAVGAWVGDFLKTHPEAAAFWSAVKPATVPTFTLRTDEMWAVINDNKDGSLRAKLGLPGVQ